MEYKRLTKKGNTKHGKCYAKIYGVWHGIKQRCFDKNRPEYERYGGRGITMFDEWLDFENFYKWAIGNGYEESLTIERIDVNENYKPSNCKWATWEEQSLNKNDTHFLEYKGVKKPLTVWAREKGINPSTLLYRIKRGWTVERALETKVVK